MTISRHERRWLLIVILIALFIANLPSLLGFLFPPHGTQYTGIDSTAPGDVNVYRSYLEQASHGKVLMQDLFTSEPQRPWLFSPFWLVLGSLGFVFHFSTLAVYFLSRIVIGAALLWLIYRIAAEIFENVRTRKLAFLLATFAGGVGAWVAPIVSLYFQGKNLEYVWPMDLWVSEAYTFLTLHHSPHFAAATLLILLSVALLARAIERQSFRDACSAGLAMLALYSFHPFHVLSLGLTSVAFWLVIFLVRRSQFWKTLGLLAIAWLIAAPSVAYQAWTVVRDPFGAGRASQNILLTPPVVTTIASYGFLLLGAIWGAVVLLRKRTLRTQLLVAWAAAHLLAIYLPVFFNRRVTQGLNIALAFLAAVGILSAVELWQKKRKRTIGPILSVVALLLGFGMSTLWVTAQDLSFLAGETGRHPPHYFYLSHDYRDAFQWLKNNGDDTSVVMTSAITGNFVPGWSGRRVVVGHNVETLRFEDRDQQAKTFYNPASTSDERLAVLQNTTTSFVVFGPWEERVGAFDPTSAGYLVQVFTTPTVAIYRVKLN